MVAIFGCGDYGKRALWEYGADNVCCFIDNNKDKQGTYVEGKSVISVADFKSNYPNVAVCIATVHAYEISEQLKKEGIDDFCVYLPRTQYYYSPDVLLINPYVNRSQADTEEVWNENMKRNNDINYINTCVKSLAKQLPLFNHIEIETYNRCNGGCSFCPVSVKNETRPEMYMSEALFKRIIDNLARLNYDGKIALFSNNEPFLDNRIITFHEYARKMLPHARFHLFTNGTRLSLDNFKEIMKYLDELIIDNYSESLSLIPNNKVIYDYCNEHPDLIKKVTIVLRKQQEILTTRGGDAPNRHDMISYDYASCMNPFRQIIVRPDGKVSLCCNDPLGKYTLGDVSVEGLEDVWFGKKFDDIRKLIAQGRGMVDKCKFCDVFTIA